MAKKNNWNKFHAIEELFLLLLVLIISVKIDLAVSKEQIGFLIQKSHMDKETCRSTASVWM